MRTTSGKPSNRARFILLFPGSFSTFTLDRCSNRDIRSLLSAFSLLLCTFKLSEVRLFLRKSHVESICSVCTRSENALARQSRHYSSACSTLTAVGSILGKLTGLVADHPLPAAVAWSSFCLAGSHCAASPVRAGTFWSNPA